MNARPAWVFALGGAAVALVAAAIYLGGEGTAYLAFGWLLFPVRTWRRVTVDWAAVAVGGAALVLFVAGLHGLARGLTRPGGVRWKLRWSLGVAALVVLAFAAGIAVVGVVHQVGWLATAREPLYVASVRDYDSAINLKRIGLDLTAATDLRGGALPPGGTFTEDGRMLHSWETAILRTGYTGFYAEIHMDKPWNDPVNQAVFKKVCPIFLNPELRGAPFKDAEGYGLSHYAANLHVMAGNYAASLRDLEGRTSTTILVGEVNARFKPWGCPVNWRDPVLGVNTSPDGFGGRPCAAGVRFLMADGSVRFVGDGASPDVLRALSSPHGEDEADAP